MVCFSSSQIETTEEKICMAGLATECLQKMVFQTSTFFNGGQCSNIAQKRVAEDPHDY